MGGVPRRNRVGQPFAQSLDHFGGQLHARQPTTDGTDPQALVDPVEALDEPVRQANLAGLAAEGPEFVPVEAIEAVLGCDPEETTRVAFDRHHRVLRETFVDPVVVDAGHRPTHPAKGHEGMGRGSGCAIHGPMLARSAPASAAPAG